MKPKWLAALALAAILGPKIPAQNSASESRAGDFIFKLPAGWTRVDQGEKTILLAPGSTLNSPATLVSIQGFDMAGFDLQTAFRAGWQGIVQANKVQTNGQIVSQHSANGLDYLYAAGVVDVNGTRWGVSLMGAQYGRRFETLQLRSSEAPNQLSAEGLDDLLTSIRFGPALPATASKGEPSTPPGGSAPASTTRSIERNPSLPATGPMSANQLPTIPGKFAGIFRAPVPGGADVLASLEIYDPGRNTPDFQFLVFYPDGTVLRGLPEMGLDDYVASVRLDISGGGKSCAKWGVYRMSGDRGQVVFASPGAAGQQLVSRRFVGDVWAIQEFSDKLRVNGSDYSLLDGGAAGMKIEGTFKPFGDRKRPGITFHRNGEFLDEGILKTGGSTALGIVGGGVAIGYGFSSPGPGPGTYRISNYTLHLNYSNGQRPGVMFWLEPGSSRNDVRTIYLGNVRLQRVQ